MKKRLNLLFSLIKNKSPYIIPKENQENPEKWGIITGVTGDIGRKYCEIMINHGYSVIGIGRNEKVLLEIKEKHRKNQFQPIKIDFSPKNNSSFQLIHSQILSQIDDSKEILFLINCIGEGGGASNFHNQSLEEIELLLKVNIDSHIIASYIFLNIIKTRKNPYNNRRFIINISSFLGSFPSSGLSIYSSCKNLMNKFYSTLSYEAYSDNLNLDIITFTPWYINTRMVSRLNVYYKVSIDYFCEETIKKVLFPRNFFFLSKFFLFSYRNEKRIGCFYHIIPYFLSILLPNCLFQRLFYVFIMKYNINQEKISDLRRKLKQINKRK